MNQSKLNMTLLLVLGSLGLVACGGGGGSASVSTNTTVGVISGFGSVYVNGCEYETTNASISVEGQSGSEDDLSVGDVVKVTGPANCTHADASHIEFADELEGIVDDVSGMNAGTGTMIIMGQTVTVTDMTTFEDKSGSVADIMSVTAGNVVEVSGYTSAQGGVMATRIEVKAVDLASFTGEIELKGAIQNLDTTAGTFQIGTLTVDYISVSHPANLADGLYVEVKFYNNAGTLEVSSIELEDNGQLGYHGDDNEEIEVNGVLTHAMSNSEFVLGEQTVRVTSSTEYHELDSGLGNLQSMLADSGQVGKLYLEVEGHFESGVLIAESVDLRDDISDNNEHTGTVSNLVVNGNSDGSLTVTDINGVVIDVVVTNSTILEDDSAAHVSKFNLTNLVNGDTVEVHYDSTTMVAIKLERK